jgi:hypothetical protein
MASRQVFNAVKTLVEANPIALYDGSSLKVVWPNDTETSPSGFWLVVQFPFSTEEHVGMAGVGNRGFREEGAIRFMLMVPRNDVEMDYALELCDTIRDLVRAKDFGGVTTFAPSPPVIDDDNDNGTQFVLSMAVPYYYDHFA